VNKIILRAVTAYVRTDLKGAEGTLAVKGREINYLGKGYIALENESTHELVALYRCMNRGELKRLKRWPSVITDKQVAPAAVKKRESTVPAILEISTVKKPSPAAKTKNKEKKANSKNRDQTDLFEQAEVSSLHPSTQ
jgi:hypothetical protein